MLSLFGQSHKHHTHITGILGNLGHIFKLWCLTIVDAVSFCVFMIFLVFNLNTKTVHIYYKQPWSNTVECYFKPLVTFTFFTQNHLCSFTPEHKSGCDDDMVSLGINKAISTCLGWEWYSDMMSLFSLWSVWGAELSRRAMKEEHNTSLVPLCLTELMADA